MDHKQKRPSSEDGSVGRMRAIVLFAVVLIASTAQGQLTQYVEADLGYQQSFMIFYYAHSWFAVAFPLHLLYLRITAGTSYSSNVSIIYEAVIRHMGAPSSHRFPTFRLFAVVVIPLVFAFTATGLLWYISCAFAPIPDVTALFSTNAFWAYVFTVVLGSDAVHTRWEIRKLIAVTIACAGVSAVVYGGAKSSSKPDAQTQDAGIEGIDLRSLAFLGDGLALAASIIAGLNTVYYSRFAVPAFETDRHLSPTSSSTLYEGEYESLPMKAEEDADARDGEPTASCTLAPFDLPPFALYPNFILSLIGSTTFLLLWIPIPIMRWMSIGPTFELPPDAKTWASLSLVAIAGVVSNAGYMVLLGIWGPVVVSVGGMLIIVLTAMSDAVFGNGMSAVTVWSLMGGGMIIGAFCVLAMDVMPVSS